MFPKLFELPWIHIPINSYGFAIMIGFLLATWVAVRRGKKLGIDTDLILDIGIIAMIAGILGAKLNYVLQYSKDIEEPGKASVFNIFDGGMNWLGGILLGPVPYLVWMWRKRKEEKTSLYSWQNGVLLGLTILLALIGTRALFVYSNPELYSLKVFKSWQSGFVLYGGLAAAIAAGALYAKMRGQSIAQIADLAGPSIMLGLAFGRIGCFLNGCCYGKVTKVAWAVKYPKKPPNTDMECPVFSDQVNDPALLDKIDRFRDTHTLPVHPTQIYETLVTLGLFFVLSWYWKKVKKRDGEVLLLTGVLYGIWRFIVEYLRGDPGRENFGVLGLTYSQTLSIAAVLGCGIWLFLLRTRPQSPTTIPASPAPAASKK